jgi:hypothetical protein
MPTASERIPAAVRPLVSERARKTLDIVRPFPPNLPSSSYSLTNPPPGREIRQRRMPPRRPRLPRPTRRRAHPLDLPAHNGGPESQSAGPGALEPVPSQGPLQGGRGLHEPRVRAHVRAVRAVTHGVRGDQLRGPGHGEYGAVGQVWDAGAEGEVVGPVVARGDSELLCYDGAGFGV